MLKEYIDKQNKLISYAQENLVGNKEHDRVDAVVYNGKEFIIFANTHASSYPQNTTYLSPGGKGFKELLDIIMG